MKADDASNRRAARSLKPLKLTLDDLLAEKKQREQSQVRTVTGENSHQCNQSQVRTITGKNNHECNKSQVRNHRSLMSQLMLHINCRSVWVMMH